MYSFIDYQMSNCIELYKDIHEDFYGIELSKDILM